MSVLVVIIPVYNKIYNLNDFEKSSISNTILKFADSPIFFVGPLSIEDEYIINYPNIKFICFSDLYFQSIDGYNKLLKSKIFYDAFSKFSFMLIVQTDAWIFGTSKELQPFYKFDYCGAPSYCQNQFVGFNGGLSLRNIKSCISALNRYLSHESFFDIVKRHFVGSSFFKFILYKWLIVMFDYFFRSRIHFLFNTMNKINEDIFWSVLVPKAKANFKINDFDTALKFSWEHNSEEFIQNHSLPFGCHGWWNYNYSFWENHIKIN